MRGGRLLKAVFLVLLALLFIVIVSDVAWPEGDMDSISNEQVSWTMFGVDETSGFGIVVFLVGVLLLVALLGGVFLAKEEKR